MHSVKSVCTFTVLKHTNKTHTMNFITNTQDLEKQIIEATNHADKNDGLTPVVTICKLKPRSRKTFYAFHFEPIGSVNVGDIQHLEDGSVRRIEYVF